MIWTMDLEMYYRLTDLKTRTSNSVLKVLEHAEMNYKRHEAGVLDKLTTNLRKWVDLLSVSRVADVDRKTRRGNACKGNATYAT